MTTTKPIASAHRRAFARVVAEVCGKHVPETEPHLSAELDALCARLVRADATYVELGRLSDGAIERKLDTISGGEVDSITAMRVLDFRPLLTPDLRVCERCYRPAFVYEHSMWAAVPGGLCPADRGALVAPQFEAPKPTWTGRARMPGDPRRDVAGWPQDREGVAEWLARNDLVPHDDMEDARQTHGKDVLDVLAALYARTGAEVKAMEAMARPYLIFPSPEALDLFVRTAPPCGAPIPVAHAMVPTAPPPPAPTPPALIGAPVALPYKEVTEALVSAFVSKVDFETMVRGQFDLHLNAITGGGTLPVIAHDLYEHFHAASGDAGIAELVRGASKERPHNPKLRALMARLAQPPAPPMSPNDALIKLRTICAQCAPSSAVIRRIVEDAGIYTGNIDFDGTAVGAWNNVLRANGGQYIPKLLPHLVHEFSAFADEIRRLAAVAAQQE